MAWAGKDVVLSIGNSGATGERGTIRIDAAGQHTRTFIAGIWRAPVRKGASVVVHSSGQLGVEESSARYKADIAPMGSTSEQLRQLRPVTYHLKTDPTIETQATELKELKQQFAELEQFNRTMQAAVMQLQSKDPRVATR